MSISQNIQFSSSAPQAHVIVVCDPAGSGKSTVAKHLATDLDYFYLDGDDFHTRDAVDKMGRGEPFTDTDRCDWLIRLSALKKKYRDVLRVLAVSKNVVDASTRLTLQSVYLHVPAAILVSRVQARTNHYMKASMVQSQPHLVLALR